MICTYSWEFSITNNKYFMVGWLVLSTFPPSSIFTSTHALESETLAITSSAENGVKKWQSVPIPVDIIWRPRLARKNDLPPFNVATNTHIHMSPHVARRLSFSRIHNHPRNKISMTYSTEQPPYNVTCVHHGLKWKRFISVPPRCDPMHAHF